MKAVVVEIRKDFAAVLSDDGRILKVKNQNYAVGQVIEVKEAKLKAPRLIPAIVAAALAIVCGIGAYAYYTPYSYVSLDVNPSIEYTLNRFDRVLKVTGVNDDGQEIIKEVTLKSLSHKKIDEAIAQVVKEIEAEGFFGGEQEGGVVISVSAKNPKKAETLTETLKETTEEAVEEEDVAVEAFSVGLQRVQEARELGVTPGKLNLVEKLRDSSENPDDVDIKEWLDKPVKEIMKEIKNNRKEAKAAEKAEKKPKPESSEESSESSDEDAAQTPDNTEQDNQLKPDKAQKEKEKAEAKEQKRQEKQQAKEEKAASKAEKSNNNGKSQNKGNGNGNS